MCGNIGQTDPFKCKLTEKSMFSFEIEMYYLLKVIKQENKNV